MKIRTCKIIYILLQMLYFNGVIKYVMHIHSGKLVNGNELEMLHLLSEYFYARSLHDTQRNEASTCSYTFLFLQHNKQIIEVQG